jgi:hypothetical protein
MAARDIDWETQISDAQFFVGPLIEQLNITDLETPQITTIDVEETILLAKDLQGQLKELEC